MTGSELLAQRERLGISAEDLAHEIGTSPHAVHFVEAKKAVSIVTASKYTSAAFAIARRDVTKRHALAAELKAMADETLRQVAELKAS